MDARVAIQLFADILYIKGVLCFEEYEAIMNISDARDSESFVERMLRDEFSPYKRGEVYTTRVGGTGE